MTPKAVSYVLITDEMLADGRGFLDYMRAAEAARDAAKGERYSGVFQRGYQEGADAAFQALVEFVNKGGRVGLPMGDNSLHMQNEHGTSFEILSLLALRPWHPA